MRHSTPVVSRPLLPQVPTLPSRFLQQIVSWTTECSNPLDLGHDSCMRDRFCRGEDRVRKHTCMDPMTPGVFLTHTRAHIDVRFSGNQSCGSHRQQPTSGIKRPHLLQCCMPTPRPVWRGPRSAKRGPMLAGNSSYGRRPPPDPRTSGVPGRSAKAWASSIICRRSLLLKSGKHCMHEMA